MKKSEVRNNDLENSLRLRMRFQTETREIGANSIRWNPLDGSFVNNNNLEPLKHIDRELNRRVSSS